MFFWNTLVYEPSLCRYLLWVKSWKCTNKLYKTQFENPKRGRLVEWNKFLQFFIHPWKPVRWNAKIFLMHAEVEVILAVLILRSWAIAYVMDMVNGDSSSLNFLNQQGLEGKDRQRIMLQSVRYYSWWYGLENPIFFVIDYKWMNCALLACPMERLNGVLHHRRIIFREISWLMYLEK